MMVNVPVLRIPTQRRPFWQNRGKAQNQLSRKREIALYKPSQFQRVDANRLPIHPVSVRRNPWQ